MPASKSCLVTLLSLLSLLCPGLPSPAPLPASPSSDSVVAAAGLAGLALAAKIAEDECDDVGISDGLCAALYDEEKCSRSADFLELRPGDQGVLPLLTTGLRRTDLVIDQTSRLNLGRNKYVDSLGDEDEYEHMDEKISAYRCSCRESTFGK